MSVDKLWRSVQQGRHSAVVGGTPADPPPELRLFVLRVSCDTPSRPLGPILDARERTERVLGGKLQLIDIAADRVRAGLRRRLLGDDPQQDGTSSTIALFNRLARESEVPCALVLESVELADRATLELVREIVSRKGWLELPLVLCFRVREPQGEARRVLEALVHTEGPDAVTRLEPGWHTTLEEPGAALDRLFSLPHATVQVLRAGAHVGRSFETALVAELLDVPEAVVLDRLQEAADRGILVDDHGDGRVRLTEDTAAALNETTLPSLAHLWHRRLAELLVVTAPDARPLSEAARETGPVPGQLAGFGGHSRAARHLVAAGEYEAAAGRFVDAAHEAAAVGAPVEALAFARQALTLMLQLPASPERRRSRVGILHEIARFQWEANGPGEDFTLARALESLDEAAELQRPDDPPELRAETAALTAGVCYDIGDAAALERALQELTKASHDLQAAGDPLGAARLLNDQAAVWVRMGDLVRAESLLQQSRREFEERAAGDPVAQLELAETDHLLARLPLHGGDQDHDDWAVALEHARSAERGYEEVGTRRELARVWETKGRLLLRTGEREQAATHLTRAVDAQQKTGDVLGLARSAGALSEVLARTGRHYEALAVLGESIELNQEKGSRRGLAYNREALDALCGELTPSQRLDLGFEIRRLQQRLEAGSVGHSPPEKIIH